MPAPVLAIDPDPAFALSVAGALAARDVHHVASVEAAADVVAGLDAVVVVLGPDIAFDDALSFVGESRLVGTVVGAVVVARRPSAKMMRLAMHAEVADVLSASWTAQDMLDAVERAAPTLSAESVTAAARPEGHGQVVTVFAAKGGCGKSTVAANLAVLLSQRGQRVCILDLDLQFGDASIMFQLQPALTIRDAVQAFDDLDSEAIRDFVTVHESGVAVLPAPLKPDQADGISGDDIEHVIDLLRGAYDYVLIDTPAAFSDHTLAAIDTSDRLIVLSSFDVPSIKNLRICLATLRELDVDPATTDIVMVRADAKVGLRLKEVERTIGATIDVAIPSDRDVTISLNHGIPLALEAPRSSVVQAIEQLAVRIAGEQVEPTEQGVAVSRARLLRRRAPARLQP